MVVKGTEAVLLVDNEEIVLEVGRDLLEIMGYRVFAARDGREALEVYKKKQEENKHCNFRHGNARHEW